MVYKSFDKKSSGDNTSGGPIKSGIMPSNSPSDSGRLSQQLADAFHKSVIRKFEN